MSRARVRRLAVPGAVAAAFIFFAALWLLGARATYHTLLDALMLESFRFPFIDTHAVLSAVECSRRGIDVLVANPCDALGRVHVYGPLWLKLAALPVTTEWTGMAGLALAAGFCVSLAALAPARGPAGLALMLAGALSPSTMFALERGNNDLVVFMLSAATGWLVLRERPFLRLLGLMPAMLAAALKFYPLTLIVLAARETARRCLLFGALALGALAVVLLPQAAQVVRVLHIVPRFGPFVHSFGAGNLGAGVGLLFGSPALAVALTTLASVLAAAGSWHISARARPTHQLTQAEQVFLMIGAALIVGCFFAGQSDHYRAIHLLFALPALIALASRRDRIGLDATILVLFLLWTDALYALVLRCSGRTELALRLALWVISEAGWWVLCACLSGLLLALLRDSPAWQNALRTVRAAWSRERQDSLRTSGTPP